MATALIVTFTAMNEAGEVVGVSSQSLTFVTPEAAAKALARIDESSRQAHGGAVFVNGTVVKDVII